MVERSNYNVKVDDILLSLLRDYHNIDSSEALTFFGSRINEMFKAEPNVKNSGWFAQTAFSNRDNKTIKFKHRNLGNRSHDKIYVLRGFYPDTHLPFKISLVVFDDYLASAAAKVIMGSKDDHVRFNGNHVQTWLDTISESALLGEEITDEHKIPYKYRNFKCMRPKGMQLYRKKDDKRRSDK